MSRRAVERTKNMTPVVKWGANEIRWRASVGAVLSAIIPGSGQLYSGKTIPGLLWLPTVAISYLASVQLGLCAHFVCALDATEHREFKGPLEDKPFVDVPEMATYVLMAMVFILVNTALYAVIGT
jgi:hypothetical protein